MKNIVNALAMHYRTARLIYSVAMKTALVVDDDTKLQELLKDYLEEYGFTVRSLPDGLRVMESYGLLLLQKSSGRSVANTPAIAPRKNAWEA